VKKNPITFAALAVVALALIAGCSKKHDDLPTAINVPTPPNVSNLVVTNPQDMDYDLTWSIADPGQVEYYRVYSSFDGTTFELVEDSVSTTSRSYSSFVPLAAFGVSVVSTAYVEGAMVVKPTP
jgi:hypothetical protein